MYTLQLLDISGTTVEATITDAKIAKWGARINGPARMEYSLPVGSPNATTSRLQKLKRVRLLRRKQDGSGEDEPVFYGYLEAHKRTSEAEYTVYCASMLQLFASRYSHLDQTLSTTGSTDAFSLLSQTNVEDGDTSISEGDGGVSTTRSVKATGRKDILGLWGDLAKAHHAEFEIDFDGAFHFVPELGSDKTDSVTLRYRTDGQPGTNVTQIAEGEDAATLRNRIIGTNNVGNTSIKNDLDSQAIYGVLVEAKVFSEAVNEATLDEMTQSYLEQVKAPAPDFAAQPAPVERRFNVITSEMDIEGFQYGDVRPGDLITCDIISESQTIQGEKRVVEILVSVDDNSQETIQYTLGEEGVFVSVNSLDSTHDITTQRRLLALEQGSGTGGGGSGSSPTFIDNDAFVGAINGSNVTYTLTDTPVSGSVYVWKNGQLLTPLADFAVSTDVVTLTDAPLSGASLVISFRTSNGSTSFFDPAAPSGAVDGGNVTFTLTNTPTSGSLYVWLNGQLLTVGVDYSLSGTTITFATAPTIGATLLVSYRY